MRLRLRLRLLFYQSRLRGIRYGNVRRSQVHHRRLSGGLLITAARVTSPTVTAIPTLMTTIGLFAPMLLLNLKVPGVTKP